ncbi:MAG: MBL fold metallo-hydrolase [bacterium]|nr:MBL fold metallo-hydrolase [bacterium]
MFVRYLGHSSFYIRNAQGVSVLFDPFSNYIPYKFPSIEADVVVLSHEHRDHNAVQRVEGSPLVVKRTMVQYPTELELNIPRNNEKLTFYGVPSFHDNFNGRRKGPNTIWHFYWEGLHFVHLGDLGQILTDDQINDIGKADILFVPVGGKTTLGPAEAGLVINQLHPNLVFPMHYLTPAVMNLGLCENTLDDFLGRMGNIKEMGSMSMDLDMAKLPPGPDIIVLNYE